MKKKYKYYEYKGVRFRIWDKKEVSIPMDKTADYLYVYVENPNVQFTDKEELKKWVENL